MIRTHPFFPCFVTTVCILLSFVASDADDSYNENDEDRRGMSRLLGPEKAAEFINTAWGGDLPYFVPASSSMADSTDLLWSLGLTESYLQNNGGKPWIYEEDIKIVNAGKVHYESKQPGTWNDVQRSLGEGATVVMHSLQNRHEPIHRLCAELEDDLQVFLIANSYLTPAGSTGFDPHYDWHDILVLQLEGSKTWTVCEQRNVDIYQYRNGKGKRIFQHGEDFGNCTEMVFQPGDLLYAPFGTIHYATANRPAETTENTNGDPDGQEEFSMHLTLSLIRQQFTWGQFLQDIVEQNSPDFSARLSAWVASKKGLQTQIPIPLLHEIAYSLGNTDLTPEFIEAFRDQAKSIVKAELPSTGKLRPHLLMLLDKSKDILEDTIKLYRVKMVFGRMKETRTCPPPSTTIRTGDDGLSSMHFRRFPHQRMMLEEVEDYGAVVVTGTTEDEQLPLPLRWTEGLRYALGARGARGKFFTVEELALKAKMEKQDAVEMIQELINECLLEMRIGDEPSAPQQDESCAVPAIEEK